MKNNIDEVIKDALTVNKSNLHKNIKTIINQIEEGILQNKLSIINANMIDKKNDNGFTINFNIIERIFSNVKKEENIYGDVILSQKDEDKKIIYGKEIFDVGNVVVINDGNVYVIIEMILRNILVGNTVIFSNNGFMYGTNQLIIEITQAVLKQYNISNLIQLYVTEEYDELLSNFANIDLVVCIGDHYLQSLILNKSKVKTIVSGYENFEIYVEDSTHKEVINNILDTGLNIDLYINEDTMLDSDKSIVVSDIDEAIAQINYTGSKYSSAIFTNSTASASKFINEVKSKMITVNTSPTIERIMDIQQSDLYIEKTIIYPLSFKISNENGKIDL